MLEFTRSAEVTELYSAAGSALVYLLPAGTRGPDTIELAAALTGYPGTFAFLEAPLAVGDQAAFGADLWAYLADRRSAGVRLAWFPALDGTGVLQGTAVALLEPSPGTFVTARGIAVTFGDVTLAIPAGTSLSVDDAAAAFRFGASPAPQLSSGWGTTPAGTIAAGMTVPCAGALGGCLQFTLALTEADLDGLDVGLRWFYAMPPGDPTDDFFLDSLRYRLFDGALTLYANLDPLAALAGARTFLAFSGADAGQPGAGSAAPVTSFLRGPKGEVVTLQPLTGSAAPTAPATLVFLPRRQTATPGPRDPLSLVPAGDFAATGAAELMCGLSGVEYVHLPGAEAVLSYAPGPAFAAGFQPGKPAGATTATPAVAPTTPWVRVTASGAQPTYYAQPDQSILYNFPPSQSALAGDANGTISPLGAVPVLAATLPATVASSPPVPLLPYAGTESQTARDAATYAQLESQVLSPQRRGAIAAAPHQLPAHASLLTAPAGAPASKYSATPQGLLATYVQGASVWDEIVLAAMPATPDPLLLKQVQGDLLSAFQRNKLFLVVSNPTPMTCVLAAPTEQIVIGPTRDQAWSFNLDPGGWATNGTILIVKFQDLSIAELVQQTDAWASPNPFNNDPVDTGQRIAAIIADAKRQQQAGDADFDVFLAAVEDRHWNGILVLNVVAPLKELPSQLAGLAVGIDQSRFFAHHVGIQASKIIVPSTPGDLGIEDSSIFGLIHYTGAPPTPGVAPYAFEVESLKVRFEHSAVASFSSTIDLEVNQLFDEPAKLRGEPSNIVRLYGVVQRHGSGAQEQDTYVFQTASGAPSVFDMTSGVLHQVTLTKGQFFTVTANDTTSYTDSRFVFWGALDFDALAFDVFSFDALAFGNLAIEMTFNPSARVPLPTFTFNATHLSLDVATSTPRDRSFYRHFPLTLAAFTQGGAGTKPTDAGFMGVQSPIPMSDLSSPWFGLRYDLDLGSPGGLAAQTGFTASILAAWSPGDPTTPAVFTGLKLPGSSGSKRQIPIEGIFDIGFQSLEIVAVPGTADYILVLYGIAFEFLSLRFPPTGQVNFVLFGDPHAPAGATADLGWYAAYAKADATPGTPA